MPTPLEVAEAWHGVTKTFFIRRNKAHDTKQWEVVEDDANTLTAVHRFHSEQEATAKAMRLNNIARGAAVLKLFETV